MLEERLNPIIAKWLEELANKYLNADQKEKEKIDNEAYNIINRLKRHTMRHSYVRYYCGAKHTNTTP